MLLVAFLSTQGQTSYVVKNPAVVSIGITFVSELVVGFVYQAITDREVSAAIVFVVFLVNLIGYQLYMEITTRRDR